LRLSFRNLQSKKSLVQLSVLIWEQHIPLLEFGSKRPALFTPRNGKVEVIPNDQGNRITPSVVSFSPSGGHLVGEAAKNNLATNPKNTIYDVKRCEKIV
jgi:hypothetical protein